MLRLQVRARFCTSASKVVTWFGRNALVTRVCFSLSSKETPPCLQKGFCFILMMKIMEPFQKPENTLFLFHLAIRLQFLGQFGFLSERVCNFVINFTFSIHVLMYLAVFFRLGMKGDG